MNMKMHLRKAVIGGAVGVLGMAGIAAASNVAVGVDISTPNARVQVGTPAPPPRVVVVERETVIVHEKDRGKHKGQHKKHKKHKKHKD
jgi:hypothetical protein